MTLRPGRRRSSTGGGAPSNRSRPRSHALPWLAALAVAAVTLAAYASAPGHTFVNRDDLDYVQQNALVLGRHYGALLRAIVLDNFHPLTMLTLVWNVRVPLEARPFIGTNVALHAVNTLLAFALAFRLSGGRTFVATLVALLFGIHPMHVESVAWISERKDVLYAAFFLSAAITYTRYLESRTTVLLAATFALFVLSCLSKGMAVVFPLLMVLIDHWMRRPVMERRAVLEKIPFVAVAIVLGTVALNVQAGGDVGGLLRLAPGHTGAIAIGAPVTPLQRAVLPAYGYLMYAWRLLVPAGLCAFHPYPAYGTLSLVQFPLAPLFLVARRALEDLQPAAASGAR